MFIEFNCNPEHKIVGDCVVRAIAKKEVHNTDLYLTREEFQQAIEQINKRLDSKFNRKGQYNNAKEQSV